MQTDQTENTEDLKQQLKNQKEEMRELRYKISDLEAENEREVDDIFMTATESGLLKSLVTLRLNVIGDTTEAEEREIEE